MIILTIKQKWSSSNLLKQRLNIIIAIFHFTIPFNNMYYMQFLKAYLLLILHFKHIITANINSSILKILLLNM